MSKALNDLPALPRSVRSMVAEGSYGLYRIGGGGAPYLLVTRNRSEFYLLSERGEVVPTPAGIKSVDDVEILAPVMLEQESGAVHINVAI
jgi:hypothetical protein